jgi:hypothetical protein
MEDSVIVMKEGTEISIASKKEEALSPSFAKETDQYPTHPTKEFLLQVEDF